MALRHREALVITTPQSLAAAPARSDLERATLAKVSWRLLPFLLLLYIVAWMDRVNIGFAALQMNGDLGFSSAVYGFGAGVFFVGYALFEVPSNIILARVGARLWIARIMITWGILSVAMMFTRGPTSFYVLRLLLGIAEAGFLPGVIYYLGHWYPSRDRARAVSWFMLAIPLSTVFGGPIAGMVLGWEGWHGLHGWQWVFLVEGVPAVVLGFVVLFYLVEGPEHASWLTPEQRTWLSERVRGEQAAAERRHGLGLAKALAHPTVLKLGWIMFCCQTGSYGLNLWIPQIVNGLGTLTSLQIGFVSAIPYVGASIGMILIGMSSDRSGERLMHIAVPSMIAGAAFITSAFLSSPVPSMIALTVGAIGDLGTRGPYWALPTRFLTGSAAAAVIGLLNACGAIGGFVGPYAVGIVRQMTGSFSGGLIFIAVLLLSASVMAIRLRGTPMLAEHEPR
jgi:ACS family tartrate transporter-like MFS transporter